MALSGSFALFMAALGAAGSAVPAAASVTSTGSPSLTAADLGSYNGLAPTPPMGYNDWYKYGCGVTATDMANQSGALVSTGLDALGYKNVNVDDCWMSGGPTTPSPTFLDSNYTSIQSLTSYIHGLGLKFGIYQSVGPTTCAGKPGLYPSGYQSAADTFASWKVDFLKLDYCGMSSVNGNDDADNEPLFRSMSSDLIDATPSYPVIYSEELPVHEAADMVPALNNSGSGCQLANVPTVAQVETYQQDVSESSAFANMWRLAPDETPPSKSTSDSPYITGSCSYVRSVISHFQLDLFDSAYARPGGWNDLDMLGAGNFDNPALYGTNAWTTAQARSQMSIWAEMASPLIMSNDLTNLPSADLTILSNHKVIAVDQDSLGMQGRLVAQVGPIDVVSKPLSGGGESILFVNTSSGADSPGAITIATGSSSYTITNLWSGTVTTNSTGAIDPGSIAAYGTAMFTVTPGSPDTTLSNPLGLCDYGGTWCVQDANGAASSGQPVSMEPGNTADGNQSVTFTMDTAECNNGRVDAATHCPWPNDAAADSQYNGDDIWQIQFPNAGSSGPSYWCLAAAENAPAAILGTCSSTAGNNLWVSAPLTGAAGYVGLLNVYKLTSGTNCMCLDAHSDTAGTEPVVDAWTGSGLQKWAGSAPLPGQNLTP